MRWQLWQLLPFLLVLLRVVEGRSAAALTLMSSHPRSLSPAHFSVFDGLIDDVVSVGTVTLIPQVLKDSSLVPTPPCSLTTRKPVE